MIFRTVENFRNDETRRGLIYFVQRFEELSSPYSLDSYKAPAIVIPYLIAEALEQLTFVQTNDEANLGSAKPVMDELLERLGRSSVAKRLVAPERSTLEALKGGDPVQIKALLEVLRREMSEQAYVMATFDMLKSAIRSQAKGEIDELSRDLVSILLNAGMSRKHIYETTVNFWYVKTERSVEDLGLFFRRIFPHLHEFIVYFKASLMVSRLKPQNFRKFGIQISENLEPEFAEAPAARQFKSRHDKERFVRVSGFRGFDRYSAVEEARQKLGLIHNLFRVYHHKENFRVGPTALVKQCCEEGIALVKKTDNFIEHVSDDSPPRAVRWLDKTLDSSKFRDGRDKQRFYSVAGFHTLSLETASIDNQTINLWIGLETISPSRPKKTNIDNVVSAITPAICLKYLSRLTYELAVDLLKWNRTRTIELFKGLESTQDEHTLASKVLSLLTLPDDDEMKKALYAELGVRELLRYRIYSLSRALRTPEKALAKIENHERWVGWQLRRIYRSRNAIVHKGVRPSYAHAAVESAHFYLDQVIRLTNELSCGPQGFDRYIDMFRYIELEYTAYKRRIRALEQAYDGKESTLIWKRTDMPGKYTIIPREG